VIQSIGFGGLDVYQTLDPPGVRLGRLDLATAGSGRYYRSLDDCLVILK
jgi:hypothetical protein